MKLSSREHEVLTRLCAGFKPGQVALDLNISIKTVSTFRMRILKKFGLNSQTELQRIAYQQLLSQLVPGGPS